MDDQALINYPICPDVPEHGNRKEHSIHTKHNYIFFIINPPFEQPSVTVAPSYPPQQVKLVSIKF